MSTVQSSSAAVRVRKRKSAMRKSGLTKFVVIGAALLVIGGIVLHTTVVHIGSDADVRQQAFSPDTFGAKEFPRIQAVVLQKAVDAVTIAPEVLADKVAAGKKYGTASTTGTVIMVKFSGVVGEGKSGIYDVAVAGMPADIKLRMQTGPAINGTDLRDAPGDIAFGSFKNQIEYQDAGSAINRAMKASVLDPIDTSSLTGKTVDVVGAFRLVNPKNWMITPVKVDVK
jgi:predicted lipoprotein